VRKRTDSCIRLWICALFLVACTTSPLGRQQLLLYPQSEVDAMGAAAFDQMRSQMPRGSSPRTDDYVECIVQRIVAVLPAETDFSGGTWEVEIFEDESANAFALPGGKIGVHSGMLEIAATPDPLAAVLAHEVAHVVAEHTNERLSTTAVAQSGLQAVQILAGSETPAQRQLMALLGVGAQIGVLLPFNRAQETEADLIGLRLMARAGFDPRASITLWERMAEREGGNPPEFLSTHPASASRIAQLRAALPDAVPLFDGASRGPRCTPPGS